VFGEEYKSKLKLQEGDILDFDLLQKTIKENKVHTIIHFVAVMGSAIKANPRIASKINVEGTLNVFEAARLNDCKVVWSSSSGAFPKETPKIEGTSATMDKYIFYPWGLYGAAKLFGENCARFYSDEYGTKIVTLRYVPIMFGAGQKRGVTGDIVRELIIKPALGKKSVVPFGNAMLNWLYVDDAAYAAVLASKMVEKKSAVYNIGGHFETMQALFDFVKSLLPDAEMQLLQEDYTGPRYEYDDALTKSELGFTPKYSLKEGVKIAINETRKFYNLDIVK
jgi:nucleoside-diphosphate-sugar epimerase